MPFVKRASGEEMPFVVPEDAMRLNGHHLPFRARRPKLGRSGGRAWERRGGRPNLGRRAAATPNGRSKNPRKPPSRGSLFWEAEAAFRVKETSSCMLYTSASRESRSQFHQ